MKNFNKNELVLLKRKVQALEEQLGCIHFFLKDAVKMRTQMDRGLESLNVDKYLPGEL